MHAAQLRLPFVFAFQPEFSSFKRRVRRPIRAANAPTDAQPCRKVAACESQDATFSASLAEHIQARASQPALTTAGLVQELAGLLADTCAANETPEQLAESLVRKLLEVAGR